MASSRTSILEPIRRTHRCSRLRCVVRRRRGQFGTGESILAPGLATGVASCGGISMVLSSEGSSCCLVELRCRANGIVVCRALQLHRVSRSRARQRSRWQGIFDPPPNPPLVRGGAWRSVTLGDGKCLPNCKFPSGIFCFDFFRFWWLYGCGSSSHNQSIVPVDHDPAVHRVPSTTGNHGT